MCVWVSDHSQITSSNSKWQDVCGDRHELWLRRLTTAVSITVVCSSVSRLTGSVTQKWRNEITCSSSFLSWFVKCGISIILYTTEDGDGVMV